MYDTLLIAKKGDGLSISSAKYTSRAVTAWNIGLRDIQQYNASTLYKT
jgi:hypothetical protein